MHRPIDPPKQGKRRLLSFIALGSSMGSTGAKKRLLFSALDALSKARLKVLTWSDFYLTAPEGGVAQNMFLNAACAVEGELCPRETLALLHAIEKLHGRTKAPPQADRTLDLDLLYATSPAGPEACHTPHLTLPHPRLHQRSFMWHPFMELMAKIEQKKSPGHAMLSAQDTAYVRYLECIKAGTALRSSQDWYEQKISSAPHSMGRRHPGPSPTKKMGVEAPPT